MKYTLFVLIVIFSCIQIGYTYDWPTPPFSRQDSIWGTMGEMRDSSGIPHHVLFQHMWDILVKIL